MPAAEFEVGAAWREIDRVARAIDSSVRRFDRTGPVYASLVEIGGGTAHEFELTGATERAAGRRRVRVRIAPLPFVPSLFQMAHNESKGDV